MSFYYTTPDTKIVLNLVEDLYSNDTARKQEAVNFWSQHLTGVDLQFSVTISNMDRLGEKWGDGHAGNGKVYDKGKLQVFDFGFYSNKNNWWSKQSLNEIENMEPTINLDAIKKEINPSEVGNFRAMIGQVSPFNSVQKDNKLLAVVEGFGRVFRDSLANRKWQWLREVFEHFGLSAEEFEEHANNLYSGYHKAENYKERRQLIIDSVSKLEQRLIDLQI